MELLDLFFQLVSQTRIVNLFTFNLRMFDGEHLKMAVLPSSGKIVVLNGFPRRLCFKVCTWFTRDTPGTHLLSGCEHGSDFQEVSTP